MHLLVEGVNSLSVTFRVPEELVERLLALGLLLAKLFTAVRDNFL